jgi:hypothetical protein
MVYAGDVINAKVNDICREFVTSSYKDIDEIVAEFDENDKNCWFWNNPKYLWFDRHRLRQLLTYIKEHGLNNFKVNVYKTFDGGRGRTLGEMTLGSPKWNKDDLAIHIIKPRLVVEETITTNKSGIFTYSFALTPEEYSYSGGEYVCTRADIKL